MDTVCLRALKITLSLSSIHRQKERDVSLTRFSSLAVYFIYTSTPRIPLFSFPSLFPVRISPEIALPECRSLHIYYIFGLGFIFFSSLLLLNSFPLCCLFFTLPLIGYYTFFVLLLYFSILLHVSSSDFRFYKFTSFFLFHM